MQRYIVIRLGHMLLTLFLLCLVVFVLTRLSGNPVYLMLPVDASLEQKEALERSLGLDQPLIVQYGNFMSNILRGDLGISMRSRLPVIELMASRLPYSLALASVAVGFALLVSFPLGVLAAVNRGKWLDFVVRLVALLGQATPSFLLGIVLMLVFSVILGLLPSSGVGGPLNFILPGVTLGAYAVAGITRLLRNSMLDVLGSEYVKLARVKGLSERVVIWKHALRNALMSVVTFFGLFFASIITMAVVVEVVFRWPGLGRLVYEGILSRDYPVVQGVILLGGFIVMFVNLLVDILYAYLDPRVRQ